MPRRSAIAFVVVSCLQAPALLAQAPERVGTEFLVNTVTVDYQTSLTDRSIDFESNGDFVVIWRDSLQDGSLLGVFGQRFASSGVKLGTSFQVSTYTIGSQTEPAVALDSDGDFVVAWVSYQDGDGRGVFARRFNSSGVAQGNEFSVNTFTLNSQFAPAVARDSDGDFVVVWTSSGQDGSSYGVFARRFNSSGVAQGSEIQVNLHTDNMQREPAVDLRSDGDFVVTWSSFQQDGYVDGIFGQRFNSLGARQGPEFQINANVTGNQSEPAVGLDANGDFVVAWESSVDQDGDGTGIFVRRFDSTGAPLRAETQVNLYATGTQDNVSLAVDATGDFVVAWRSVGQDGDLGGIFARHFRSSGVPTTADLPVNSTKTGEQDRASVRSDADGDFAVVWNSPDGDANGVFGQRYDVQPLLDIDGNGELTALTDGVLVLRFLFGFTGATLTSGAIGANCMRCDAAAILSYLQGLT